jgi:UDP-glucose 4-epimerase
MAIVLVTGGAGYIGSHTCKAVAQAGFGPITYDNLSTGNSWAVRWGHSKSVTSWIYYVCGMLCGRIGPLP